MHRNSFGRLWFLLVAAMLLIGCVAVASAEGLNAPALTVDNVSDFFNLSPGSGIMIHVGEVEGASVYGVRVVAFLADDEGPIYEEEFGTYAEIPNPITVDGNEFQEGGIYSVAAYVKDENGHSSDNAIIRFVCQENGVAENAITLKRSTEDAIGVYERISIGVFAPGADRLNVICQEAGADWRIDGSSVIVSFGGLEDPGTWPVRVTAFYQDGTIRSAETAITVSESNGDIGAMTGSAPASIPANTDLTYSWTEPTNISAVKAAGVEVTYHYWLHDIGEENTLIQSNDIEAGEPVVISKDLLTPGHAYDVGVYTTVPGWGFAEYAAQVMVEAENASAHQLSLRVRRQGEGWQDNGTLTVESNEEFRVGVWAPDATAVSIYNGRWWDYLNYWNEWNDRDENGYFEFDYSRNANGTFESLGSMYVRAYYGDVSDLPTNDWGDPIWQNVDWSQAEYSSNSIGIQVISNGWTPEPQAALPDSVERNAFLAIPIANAQDIFDLGGYVFGEIKYENNENVQDSYSELRQGEDTLYLPTVNLAGGQQYKISVGSRIDGYIDSRLEKWVTATDENASFFFEASKTNVDTCEQYVVTARVPGANQLRLYDNGDPNNDCGYSDGDTIVAYHANWGTDSRTFTLQADRGNGWEDVESLTVDTYASKGDQPYPTMNLPAEITMGEDLVLDFSDYFDYNFGLNHPDGHWIYGKDDESVTVVPASVFEENGTGVYYYWVDLAKPGYDNLHLDFPLVVMDGQSADGDITITVNDQTSALTVPVNTNVHTVITAPENATAILAYGGYDWQWNDGSTADFDHWSFGDASQRVLTAKYTTDPLPYDDMWNHEDEWDNLNWSGLSNRISLTVTREGFAPEAVINLAQPMVVRGQDMTFTVANPEDFDGFNWNIYDPVMQGWMQDWKDWDGRTTISFGTQDLWITSTRTLELHVSNYGTLGLQGSEAVAEFQVFCNPGTAPQVTGIPASVTRGEFLTIRIQNPTVSNSFFAWFEDGEANRCSDISYWDGVDTIRLSTQHLDTDHDYTVVVANNGGQGIGMAGTWQTIRILPPSEAGMYFSKTDVQANETFTNSINVPDAVEFSMTINEEEGWNWENVWQFGPFDGESTGGEGLRFDHAGEYTLHLYARYEGSDEWTDTGLTTTFRVSGDDLDPRDFIPETLAAGEPLNIQFPDRLWDMNFFFYDDDNGDRIEEFHWHEGDEGDPNISIPADRFEAYHSYHVDFDIQAVGYNHLNEGGLRFLVIGEADDSVTLNVSETIQSGEDIVYSAHAENATAIKVTLLGGNYYETRCYQGDSVSDSWNYRADSDVTVYASACYDTDIAWPQNDDEWRDFDWNALNWSSNSATQTVAVTYIDQVQIPEVIVPESVERGQYLEVQVGQADHAAWYHVRIRDINNNEELDFQELPANGGTAHLATSHLGAGEYEVEVYMAGLPGYFENGTRFRFTVTENETPEPLFIAASTRVGVYENVLLTLHDPGAEAVKVIESGNEENEYGSWEGESAFIDYRWNFHFEEPDEYTIIALGLHEGQWTQFGELTITVYSNGPLDGTTINAPQIVNAGDDLIFSITLDGNADPNMTGVHLYDATMHGQNIENWDGNPDNQDYTVGPDRLELGHEYVITVSSAAFGYEMTWTEHRLMVVGDTAEEEVALTINGESEYVSAACNTPLQIQLTVPDSTTKTQIYWDARWQDVRSDETFDNWDVVNEEQRIVTIRVTNDEITDDTDWDSISWFYSNAVTLDIWANDRVNADELQPWLDTETHTVRKGDMLTVNWHPVNHAVNYHVKIQAYDDNGWHERFFFQTTGTTATLPTAALSPDENYFVEIVALGEAGYACDGVGNPDDENMCFAVTEENVGDTFVLAKTEIILNEEVPFNIYAPGAEMVRFVVMQGDEQREDRCWDGESVMDMLRPGGTGDHTAIAYALRNGEWEEIGTVGFRVDSLGTLAGAAITAPGTVLAGEDLTFQVAVEDNADANGTWIYVLDTEDDWSEIWRWHGDPSEETLTVEAERLTAGRIYVIEVHTYCSGYENGRSQHPFLVREGTQQTIILTINGETEELTTPCNREIPAELNAPGATAAQIFLDRWWQRIEPNEQIMIGTGAVEQQTIFCRVTYDEITENTNWDDLNWVYGNAVIVNFTGEGEVAGENLHPQLSANEVARGHMLSLTWDAVEHARCYHVRIFGIDENGNVEGERFFQETQETQISLPTGGLDVGQRYLTHIIAIGEEGWQDGNWDDNDESMYFTVTAADEGITLELGKTELLVGEDVPYSIYAPGALHVSLAIIENDDYDHPREEWYTDGDSAMSTYYIWGTGTFTAFAYANYEEGGDWIASETQYTVTVNKIGDLDTPSIIMAPSCKAGDQLVIDVGPIDHADGNVHIWMTEQGGSRIIDNEFMETFGTYASSETFPHAGVYDVNVMVFGETGYVPSNNYFAVYVADENTPAMNFPAALTEVEEEAFEGSAVQIVNLPNGVTTIGARAFKDCTDLMFISIPDSVTEIGSNAFEGCGKVVFETQNPVAIQYAEDNGIYCR